MAVFAVHVSLSSKGYRTIGLRFRDVVSSEWRTEVLDDRRRALGLYGVSI